MAKLPHTILTLVACLLGALTAGIAYCMLMPVRWDGLGKLGAAALSFPLHLLGFTALSAALTILARRLGARLASLVLGVLTLLTAVMALAPAIAVWRLASELAVPLSLSNYLAHAAHRNTGPAQPDRSVSYGVAADGTELFLDVWLSGKPNVGPLRPAIVMVHGGAWNDGNRSMTPDWNRWLNELGYEVFDVEYRLPPPARWRDEVGDVKSALGWVAAHAAQYHLDPQRISLMGASAGGNLSLLAAYSAGEPELPPSSGAPTVAVRSVINLYGPTDLVLLYRGSASPGYVQPSLRSYIGGTPEELPERYRALSPLHHVTAKAPPTITLLGESDRVVSVEHATLLGQALSKARVAHQTIFLPATDHGFDDNWGGFATQLARSQVRAFLLRFG